MTDTANMTDKQDLPEMPEKAGPKRFIPLGVLLAGLAVFFALGGQDYLSLQALADNRAALQDWVAAHKYSAIPAYIAVYALSVAFSVPGATILTIAGGFLFGTLMGGVYAVTGATLGAVAVFMAARTAFRDTLRKRAGKRLKKLEDGFRDNAASYLLVLRLVPLFPFWLVNLAPAFFGVPLRVFAVTTFFGIMPGGLVYASVGNGLGAVLARGGNPDLGIIFQPEVLTPILGLAALSMIPVFYRRFRNNADSKTDKES